MALAAICSEIQYRHKEFNNAFKGFIVDHGVREESAQEAKNVAAELLRLGIPSRILKLYWGQDDPKALSKFETAARRLRYRALGAACWEDRINRLLVAHHADDKAETVLVRLTTGYTGTGLQGVQTVARIPDCEGIYGVDASGAKADILAKREEASNAASPHSNVMFIESGGVNIHRPLLSFTKEELIAFCEQRGVRWFEDHTNADKTLTLRNTARHLMKENFFPGVFRRERLLQMANTLIRAKAGMETAAQDLFCQLPITLDLRSGKATIEFNQPNIFNLADTSPPEAYHIKALLLRRLLSLVSPKREIDLQDLDPAIDLVFPEARPTTAPPASRSKTAQIAGVHMEREASDDEGKGGFLLTLTRAVPNRDEIQMSTPLSWTQEQSMGVKTERNTLEDMISQHLHARPSWSEWVLWDSRYWIRYQIPPQHLRDGASYSIRFLSLPLLQNLRKSLEETDPKLRAKLDRYLKGAPTSSRWTLPAIVVQRNGEEETVKCLPSLRWTNDSGDCLAEIGYKHVNFRTGRNEKHRIVKPRELMNQTELLDGNDMAT